MIGPIRVGRLGMGAGDLSVHDEPGTELKQLAAPKESPALGGAIKTV